MWLCKRWHHHSSHCTGNRSGVVCNCKYMWFLGTISSTYCQKSHQLASAGGKQTWQPENHGYILENWKLTENLVLKVCQCTSRKHAGHGSHQLQMQVWLWAKMSFAVFVFFPPLPLMFPLVFYALVIFCNPTCVSQAASWFVLCIAFCFFVVLSDVPSLILSVACPLFAFFVDLDLNPVQWGRGTCCSRSTNWANSPWFLFWQGGEDTIFRLPTNETLKWMSFSVLSM